MTRNILVLILAIIISTAAITELEAQYVPVSRRYPGLIIGNENAPVTVELVYDLTCTLQAIQVIAVRSLTRLSDKPYPNLPLINSPKSLLNTPSVPCPITSLPSSFLRQLNTPTIRRVQLWHFNFYDHSLTILKTGTRSLYSRYPLMSI
jgi:hypothetical protein